MNNPSRRTWLIMLSYLVVAVFLTILALRNGEEPSAPDQQEISKPGHQPDKL